MARAPAAELVAAWRYRGYATTYVRRATERLRSIHGRTEGDQRWANGYEAGLLLEAILQEADVLASLVDDPDTVSEAERLAGDIAHRLRRRRLAAALSNVEGRTPEESAAYLARSEEMAR